MSEDVIQKANAIYRQCRAHHRKGHPSLRGRASHVAAHRHTRSVSPSPSPSPRPSLSPESSNSNSPDRLRTEVVLSNEDELPAHELEQLRLQEQLQKINAENEALKARLNAHAPLSIRQEDFDRLVELATALEGTPGSHFDDALKAPFNRLHPLIRNAIYHHTYLLCDPAGANPWPIGEQLFNGDINANNATRALAIRHFLMLSLASDLASSRENAPAELRERFEQLPEQDRRDILNHLQYILMQGDGQSLFDSPAVPNQNRAEAISRALLQRIAEFHREHTKERFEAVIAAQRQRNEELQLQLLGLQDALDEAGRQGQSLKDELAVVQSEKRVLETHLAAARDTLKDADKEIVRLQNEIDLRNARLKAAEEHIIRQDAAIAQLRGDKVALEAKVEQAQKQTRDQIEKARVNEAAAAERIRVLQGDLNAAGKQVADTQAQLEAAKENLRKLEAHARTSQAASDEQIRLLKGELDAAAAKVKAAQEQLQKANEQARVGAAAAADQIRALQGDLKVTADKVKDQTAQLQAAQEQLRKANEQARVSAAAAADQIRVLQGDLKAADAKVKDQTIQLQAAQEQLRKANEDARAGAAAAVDQIRALQGDLGVARADAARKAEELNAAGKRIAETQAELEAAKDNLRQLEARARASESASADQIRALQGDLGVSRADTARKAEELNAAGKRIAADQDKFRQVEREARAHESAAAERIRELQGNLDATQEQLLQLEEHARANASDASGFIKNLESRLDAVKTDAARKAEELNAAGKRISQTQAQLDAAQERLREMEGGARVNEASLAKKIRELQGDLDAARDHVERKTFEAKAVQDRAKKQKAELDAAEARVKDQAAQLLAAEEKLRQAERDAQANALAGVAQLRDLQSNLNAARDRKSEADAQLQGALKRAEEQAAQLHLAQQRQLELEADAASALAINQAEKIKLQSAHEDALRNAQAIDAEKKRLEAQLALQQEEQRRRMEELARIQEEERIKAEIAAKSKPERLSLVENPESREMQEAGHQAEQLVEHLRTIGVIKVANADIFNANRDLLELLPLIAIGELSFKKPHLNCNGRSYTPEMKVSQRTSTIERQLLDLRQRLSTITPQQMRTIPYVFDRLTKFCREFNSTCAEFNQRISQFSQTVDAALPSQKCTREELLQLISNARGTLEGIDFSAAKRSYERLKAFTENRFIPLFSGIPAKHILEIKLLAKELEKQKEIYPSDLIKSLDTFIESFNRLMMTLTIQK